MLDLVFTRSSKEIDDWKFNLCLKKSNHVALVFSICVEEFYDTRKYHCKKTMVDEIKATLNEIDWAVKLSDKDVSECYEIFLKFHEKIIEECVQKIIDKTEDKGKRMKHKQKWLNWKVKFAL